MGRATLAHGLDCYRLNNMWPIYGVKPPGLDQVNPFDNSI